MALTLSIALAVPSGVAAKDGSSSHEKKSKVAGSSLVGQVLGSDGKPVSGAIVSVRSVDGDASWSSHPSDKRGKFLLEALPYGWADLVVSTRNGDFLGDQAINLPPGTKVVLNFSLLETGDKPASWWTERRVERPAGMSSDKIAGMALSSQRLTGVEYWKSPAGIAILASVAAVALGLVAAGGKYHAPANPVTPVVTPTP